MTELNSPTCSEHCAPGEQTLGTRNAVRSADLEWVGTSNRKLTSRRTELHSCALSSPCRSLSASSTSPDECANYRFPGARSSVMSTGVCMTRPHGSDWAAQGCRCPCQRSCRRSCRLSCRRSSPCGGSVQLVSLSGTGCVSTSRAQPVLLTAIYCAGVGWSCVGYC